MSINSTHNKHCANLCMRSSVLKRVLNGNFHHKQVTKMNSIALESLVLRLLEYPSVKAGTKTSLSLPFNKERPITYSSGVLSVKSTKTVASSNKVFRDNLIQFVLNCCEYFRGYKETWLPSPRPWRVNDENFDAIGGRGVKRKSYRLLNDTVSNKKRKTLFSINDRVLKVPLVDQKLNKLSQNHIVKPHSLNQSEFLGLLNLGHNNNVIAAKSQVPNSSSRIVKLGNCPQIPLSSDIGKVMMQKENCSIPNYIRDRKLERTEWYVNKAIPKCTDNKFEVSYVPKKNSSIHVYKFPVRQYQQIYNERHCTELLLKRCKPLSIVINNIDLVKKKKLKMVRLSVIVSKLSIKELKKHSCKNIQLLQQAQSVICRFCSKKL